jgi:hypothetical protein
VTVGDVQLTAGLPLLIVPLALTAPRDVPVVLQEIAEVAFEPGLLLASSDAVGKRAATSTIVTVALR